MFVDYFRVVDGKIVECEAVRDRLEMILQLGGIPPRQRCRSASRYLNAMRDEWLWGAHRS